MSSPLVVVGDVLLDVDVEGSATRLCPDAPVPVVDVGVRRDRAGGAGLAATLTAAAGPTRLVCALGGDDGARRLGELLCPAMDVVPLSATGGTVTKLRVRAGGHSVVRLDSGDARAATDPLPQRAVDAIRAAGAILVSDYGHGVTAHPQLRELLTAAAESVPLVWDPHPNGATPVAGATLVTPNRAEAAMFAGGPHDPDAQAAALARRWHARAVAVTVGASGAVLSGPDSAPVHVPVPTEYRRRTATDSCGAGDRFASAALAALHRGASVAAAVRIATATAAEFVAAGGAGAVGTTANVGAPGASGTSGALGGTSTLPTLGDDPLALAERVHRSGGRLVAAGGCFDLLHAGHVDLLQQARRLGDALIVCLNSDASVRRAKGPGRPVVTAADRARVLRALAAVDAVAVFDEPTPTELLSHLRPDVWVKGADYADRDLPEAATLRRTGGEVVFVPVLDGYSTTRLVQAAATIA